MAEEVEIGIRIGDWVVVRSRKKSRSPTRGIVLAVLPAWVIRKGSELLRYAPQELEQCTDYAWTDKGDDWLVLLDCDHGRVIFATRARQVQLLNSQGEPVASRAEAHAGTEFLVPPC